MADLAIQSIGPGKKIQAIMVYREWTGADLAEAVAALDTLPVVLENLTNETAQRITAELQELGCTVEVIAAQRSTHAQSEKTERVPVSQQSENEISFSKDVGDVGGLPRAEILPILSEIEQFSEEYYQNITQKWQKESALAKNRKHYQEILGQKPLNIKAIYWVLLIVGLSFSIIPGILVFIFLRPRLLAKDSEVREKKQKENEQEAEAFKQSSIIPLETELDDLNSRIDEMTASGRIEWAKSIVGNDIFETRSTGELIDLISSHRADNLKEALNLYDNTKHREKMEDMQAGMLANSDTMTMESVKQTELARKTEKNTRETATASKWTAVNTYRTYRNTKPKRR